ncbi:MAG: hypothetical protein QNJ53_29345 [Pleurocapsa sp. MO_192.B19]|nr:hypothetical protein [Pleurocapsa sp. MO_192.B19]
MKKSEAINLLNSEGWTKEDAKKALTKVNFGDNPDELTIRKAASSFAGEELLKRQRLQAAQKSLVTKKTKEIEKYKEKIGQTILTEKTELKKANEELKKVNEELKKDNKRLKNVADLIKLKLAQKANDILQYKDSEIREAVIKLFHSTLG